MTVFRCVLGALKIKPFCTVGGFVPVTIFVMAFASSGLLSIHSVGNTSTIATPASQDVLFGRGTSTNEHRGNVFFRHLVQANKAQYGAAKRNRDKDVVARKVETAVMEAGGRFLIKKRTSQTFAEDAWEIADTRTVLQKVKQAMRDCGRSNTTFAAISDSSPVEQTRLRTADLLNDAVRVASNSRMSPHLRPFQMHTPPQTTQSRLSHSSHTRAFQGQAQPSLTQSAMFDDRLATVHSNERTNIASDDSAMTASLLASTRAEDLLHRARRSLLHSAHMFQQQPRPPASRPSVTFQTYPDPTPMAPPQPQAMVRSLPDASEQLLRLVADALQMTVASSGAISARHAPPPALTPNHRNHLLALYVQQQRLAHTASPVHRQYHQNQSLPGGSVEQLGQQPSRIHTTSLSRQHDALRHPPHIIPRRPGVTLRSPTQTPDGPRAPDMRLAQRVSDSLHLILAEQASSSSSFGPHHRP